MSQVKDISVLRYVVEEYLWVDKLFMLKTSRYEILKQCEIYTLAQDIQTGRSFPEKVVGICQ